MFMETRLRGGRGRNNKGVNREKKRADAVGTKRRGEEDGDEETGTENRLKRKVTYIRKFNF